MWRDGTVAIVLVTYMAFCAAAQTLLAADIWVSASLGNDENGDGSRDAPYATIQKGVDTANTDDVVKIMAGVYDTGYRENGSHRSRVVIDKRLTLVGVDGMDVTHIVGSYAPNASNFEERMAEGAVRCITISGNAAAGTVIRGMTIRDGASGNGGEVVMSFGGGVCGYDRTSLNAFYLVDCVVSNCVAKWGGAIHGGTAVRCIMRNNMAIGPGSCSRFANLLNCLVVGNLNLNTTDQRPAVAFGTAVNCTVYGTHGTVKPGAGLTYGCNAYNCVSFGNSGMDMSPVGYSQSTAELNIATNGSYTAADHPYMLFSTSTDDFRLTAGSPAVGGGRTEHLAHISLPDGIGYHDLAGNDIDLSSATCDAGCVQGAVEPGGGRIVFLSAYEVAGHSNLFGGATCYYTPESWPTSVRVRPLVADVKTYAYASIGGYGEDWFRRVFPMMDGSHIVVPPPFDGTVKTFTAKCADTVVYAAPSADEHLADGTAAHPFATLQNAVDHATNVCAKSGICLVLAKPGTYDKGGREHRGVFTRLVIPAAYPIVVRSTEGAEKTVIKGAVDETNSGYYPGCGPAAVRCVAINANTLYPNAIQGFTIADGRSHRADYRRDLDEDRAGGVYGDTSTAYYSAQALDCVITNCAAVRCGAGWNATFQRCRFYDCHGYGGVMRSVRLIGSYVDPSCTLGSAPSDASINCVFGNDTSTMFVTAPGADTRNNGNTLISSILTAENLNTANEIAMWGSVLTGVKSVSAAQAAVATGRAFVWDVNFTDAESGDWRLRETTPARTAVILPQKGTDAYAEWAKLVSVEFQGDIEGNHLLLSDGKPLPGCYQSTSGGKSAFVAAQHDGVSIVNGTVGDNVLTDGSSISLSIDASTASRPVIGFAVNGSTNLLDDATDTFTITAADIAASDHGVAIEALYSSEWYVNAADGNDSASGFSRLSPKRSLAAVMADVQRGDTVHAASGVYDEGVMQCEGGDRWDMFARVSIPAGVSLVADDGPESTFICGAKASAAYADEYGLGYDAVRGVYLNSGSRISGFTVTGGYTRWDETGYSASDVQYSGNWSGGGICGYTNGRADSYVENCTISNNFAVYGGGGRFANFIRCRFLENHATANGGAMREANIYGCVIDRSYSGTHASRASCCNFTRMVGCTIGPSNWTLSGEPCLAVAGASSDKAIFHDNLVLGKVGSCLLLTNTVTGCVFADDCSNFPTNGTCIVVPSSELEVDGNLRPIVGRNVAIDRGSLEALAEHSGGLLGDGDGVDASGFRRVMNSRVDVGALEADWRPVIAKALGDRGALLSVMDATSHVVTNAVAETPSVSVSDGESVSFTWGTSSHPASRRGKVAVTGEGTLALLIGGETNAMYTASDGEMTFTISPMACGSAIMSFVFVGDGSADLYGFSSRLGTVISVR